MPTHGRGHFLCACMVWRWSDAGALQYLDRTTTPPEWVASVPATLDRPHWIPAHATAYLLAGDETAYTWEES